MQYQGKTITRFKEKEGGKNTSPVDGFYRSADGNEFFVKKPADKGELFAELFAGLLLKEFMNEGLIDKEYWSSLICADVIKFEDGSYGLIQPLVSFDELHKVIGTSYRNGSDRNPGKEALNGPGYYTALTQQGNYFGLSMALMFSLLFSAHSVHSGNIVILKNKDEKASKQYGRIDWGDAFRYLAHLQNNDDILYAYENRGLFNIKKLTKDYFLNYKKIKGIYPAMAEKAKQLQDKMSPHSMQTIVSNALKQIPADLMDLETQKKFANYIAMPSFEDITFGLEGNCEPFAKQMADLLGERLVKISVLKDLNVQETEENMYRSVIVQPSIILSFNEKGSFPSLMQQWEKELSKVNKSSTLDISNLELSKLAGQYNDYLNEIAALCEQLNVWEHTPDSANMFQPFDAGIGTALHGHAFIGHYKESTVLRRLCSVEPSNLNLSRFAAFEAPSSAYSKKYPESAWHHLENLLVAGQGIINDLKMIRQANELGFAEDVSDAQNRLKEDLTIFHISCLEVSKFLPSSEITKVIPSEDSSFFYPITNEQLNQMNGDQLATICLEELNNPFPRALIMRILKNEDLWLKIEQSFVSGAFNGRLDKPLEKIVKINKWHQLLQSSTVTTAKDIQLLEGTKSSLEDLKIELPKEGNNNAFFVSGGHSEGSLTSKEVAHEKQKVSTQESYHFGDFTRGVLKRASKYQFGDITKGALALVSSKPDENQQPSKESVQVNSSSWGSFFQTKKTTDSQSPPSNEANLQQ